LASPIESPTERAAAGSTRPTVAGWIASHLAKMSLEENLDLDLAADHHGARPVTDTDLEVLLVDFI